MKLITTDTYQGYYLEDIEKNLDAEKYKKFRDWFAGQTGAIHNGKLVVYKYDYERFLKGLPVID